MSLSVKSLLAEAERVAGDPRRFGGYAHNPVGFARDVLGVELWSKQREVLEAIVAHRRLAVKSGHGVGKSFVLACATLWWLYARQGMVVTTASSWHQVERVLWREIKALHKGARVPLPGTRMQTELRVEEDWWAIGLSTDNPTAFQGQHHKDLLVVADEAPGIDADVHEAIASLATGRGNRLVLIGNPTEPVGPFHDAFRLKSWKTLSISCLDHPNVVSGIEGIPGAVTREWVEERREEYGELDPRWQVRIEGNFPTEGSRQVLPLAWLARASDPTTFAAKRAAVAHEPVIFALDVARFGSNKSVIAVRQGEVIVDLIVWQGASIVESMRRVSTAMQEWHPGLVVVDDIGVGGGLFDLMNEAKMPVVGYNAGARAADATSYDNLRSEGWFRLRDRLEHDRLALPEFRGLQEDLSAPTYSFGSSSRLRVERKEQMARRGIESPDMGDAVMMAFSMDLDSMGRAMEPLRSMQGRAAFIAGRDMAMLPVPEEEAYFFGGIPVHGY